MMELVSGNGFAREGYPVRGLFSIPFAGLMKTVFRNTSSTEK